VTASPLPAAVARRLRARLAADAEREGLLDVAFRTVESPVGRLLLATTPRGLVRVAFEREGFDDVLESLARDVSPRVLDAPRRLDAAAKELDAWWARRRHRFDVPLDLRLARGFRRRVLERLSRNVGYGTTSTYAALAAAAGRPSAARAAGTACATNPLPVFVPCHRVLRSDGGLGGYLGGLAAKRALLALER
jgi:methylated-DNA-[protein]-cysteine S-methyltransferase